MRADEWNDDDIVDEYSDTYTDPLDVDAANEEDLTEPTEVPDDDDEYCQQCGAFIGEGGLSERDPMKTAWCTECADEFDGDDPTPEV